MKTKNKQITIKLPAKTRIAILVGEYNEDVCQGLLDGALKVLQKISFPKKHIRVLKVPGAFELPLAASWLAKKVDAIVCLGAVIRGDTAHFDYVCQAVTQGLTRVQLDYKLPVAFGVLTVDKKSQALERASDDEFNKGGEAVLAVLKMIELKSNL
jgi:6,7-dimethyl-8-ribityllumazine synthase